jgi:hypothetical protein
MNGQQVNRVSRKVLIILSLTALLAVLSGRSAGSNGRRHGGTYLSALNRGPGTHDLTFPRHGGLEAAYAELATISVCGRCFDARVWSPLLP